MFNFMRPAFSTKFFSDIFPRTVILGHLASVWVIIRYFNNETRTSLLKYVTRSNIAKQILYLVFAQEKGFITEIRTYYTCG